MASVQTYLDLISRYESNNQNVPNYRYGSGYTAQGYYQITNTNWNAYAPLVGIDTTVYPNAMAASRDLQARVAAYLLTQTPAGIGNWASYNPQLASALSAAGLQTSGQVLDFSTTVTSNGGPIVDLTGEAAATPTASILDQIGASVEEATGIDVTPTEAGVAIALVVAAAIFVSV